MDTAQIINISSNEKILNKEIENLRHQLVKVQAQLSEILKHQSSEYVMVYKSGVYVRVSVNEIIQIQSSNNYSTFYLDDGSKILTSKTLKYWESELNNRNLVRIHHSTLINKNKVKKVNLENSEIMLFGDITTKYSRMSKSSLLHKLSK